MEGRQAGRKKGLSKRTILSTGYFSSGALGVDYKLMDRVVSLPSLPPSHWFFNQWANRAASWSAGTVMRHKQLHHNKCFFFFFFCCLSPVSLMGTKGETRHLTLWGCRAGGGGGVCVTVLVRFMYQISQQTDLSLFLVPLDDVARMMVHGSGSDTLSNQPPSTSSTQY